MKMKNFDVNIGTKDNASFQEFLIAEYNNIAAAHFNTSNTISSFFRYYLLIVTIPMPVAAFFIQNSSLDLSKLLELTLVKILGVVSFGIFLVGICVVVYMMNLRFDAILYARTVNGIRNYFYNLSRADIYELKKLKVLPTSISAPLYTEWWFFYPVVLALSILNSAYLLTGVYIAFPVFQQHSIALLGTYSLLFSASVSTIIYIRLSRHREKIYLSRPIIGVDIDGVLNLHRHQFCKILKKNFGKDINPESITKIPVQECETLECSVDEAECKAVFSDPIYWETMPVAENCAPILEKLSNAYNYRIEIFTYRPDPNENNFPDDRKKEFVIKWNAVDYNWRTKNRVMKKITKKWLKENSIPYNKLTIESGDEYTPNPKMLYKNRIQRARKKSFAYFVEDDFTKANRLAQFCGIVFLIDHPYNKDANLSNGKNIIRVKDWDEILKIVRDRL